MQRASLSGRYAHSFFSWRRVCLIPHAIKLTYWERRIYRSERGSLPNRPVKRTGASSLFGVFKFRGAAPGAYRRAVRHRIDRLQSPRHSRPLFHLGILFQSSLRIKFCKKPFHLAQNPREWIEFCFSKCLTGHSRRPARLWPFQILWLSACFVSRSGFVVRAVASILALGPVRIKEPPACTREGSAWKTSPQNRFRLEAGSPWPRRGENPRGISYPMSREIKA